MKVLNDKQSKTFHIVTLLVGCLSIVCSSVSYVKLYETYLESGRDYDCFAVMMVCVTWLFLGSVMCIVNFNIENRGVCTTLWIIWGVVLGGVLFNEQVRVAGILFVITIAFYLITMRFLNVFSTLITMSLSVVIYAMFVVIFLKFYSVKNAILFLYLSISLFLVCYRIFGVKINQLFMGKVLGAKGAAKKYNKEQLVTQITFLYLLCFVLLNVYFYKNKLSEELLTLLNNSFLTALTVNQIDWNRWFNYLHIKESA